MRVCGFVRLQCNVFQRPCDVGHRNLSVAELYELAIKLEQDSKVVSSGALSARSYAKTGE